MDATPCAAKRPTAYELTQQMRRALRWAWPRSEANLYGEIKRLVPPGLAHAVEEDNGRRTRTRQITDDGRTGVGFTPGTRRMITDSLAFYRAAAADQPRPSS